HLQRDEPGDEPADRRPARQPVAGPHDAQLCELRDELMRELRRRPVVVGDGPDFSLHEVTHAQDQILVAVGDQLLIAVAVAVQRRECVARFCFGHDAAHVLSTWGYLSANARGTSVTVRPLLSRPGLGVARDPWSALWQVAL